MNKPDVSKVRTSPAIKDGFDRDPDEKHIERDQQLYVYRAHGDTSKMIGRFYFTPHIGGAPRMNWTADLLERELNAALWGNDFKYLAKFRVLAGVKYKIGPIAQDNYGGMERDDAGVDKPFKQFSYFKTAGLFNQVQIDMTEDWRKYLDLVEDTPINPGRFSARGGSC